MVEAKNIGRTGLMDGKQPTITGRLDSPSSPNICAECFVGYSQEAAWSTGLQAACKEALRDLSLTPWFAVEHFDPNQPLIEKVIQAIAQTRYGIYDLSHWKRNEHDDNSEWIMPRNVLIELGIAIALNRPILLLRHRKNGDRIKLPGCFESISILEFGGSHELKGILKNYLPGWISTSPDQDWWNRYCTFGRTTCEYREVYPHTRQMGQHMLYGHVADGQDADRRGFREIVKEILGRFKDVSFCFLDDEQIPKDGYRFLFCSYCQLVRSSPFAIYYITPKTSAETFIAIGISIALEAQFRYKIPKIFFTTNIQYVPSLLLGYQIIVANDDRKQLDHLRQFMPKVLHEIRSRGWKQPAPLPFIEVIPRQSRKPEISDLQEVQAKAQEHYEHGNELVAAHHYNEALLAYEQAIQCNPEEGAYHYSKGLVFYNLSSYEASLAAYSQALLLTPFNAYIHNAKGMTLSALKRYDDALTAYDQAIQLSPNEGLYYYNRGLVLYELTRYQEAVASYGLALQYIPNHAWTYASRGRAFFSLQEYQKAIESFDRALAIDATLTRVKEQRDEADRLLRVNTISNGQVEVLGERYQLQDPIGRGGMATIYRGRDLRMDRVVAIKVLREVYSTDPKFVTRFQREARAMSSLQHPNIVQAYDYGQSDGNYFIVMELIEGTDLHRYLRSRGVLAVDRAIIIAHDVALGLGAAHRRAIVHRDVKPQNILVGRDGSIKLTDFGIASIYKDINAERLTTTGMILGPVHYFAPEQAQGEIVSPAADVYALGIVMYEMLTGRTPFDGDTPVAMAMQHIQDAPMPPRQLNPNIPPALEEIILRCLEKVPEMRFADGSVLARALELLGEEELKVNTTLASSITSPLQNQAHIVILSSGQIIPLKGMLMIVGRQDPTMGIFPDINLADKTVGRLHAHLRNQQGTYIVEDLNTLNKTRVNGIILEPHKEYILKDGDIVRFGSVEVRFNLK